MSVFVQLPSVLESESYISMNALERISDAFITLNPNWQFTYINTKAVEFFKRPSNELLGKFIFEEFPGGIGEKFPSKCQQAFLTQETQTLEEYLPNKQQWIEYRVYPSNDGVSVIIRDITQRKQSDIALQESEQQFRRMVNTSDEGIWILDERFYTRYVNHRLCEMLGYHPGEMIGHLAEDFVFPEDKKDHKQRMKNRKNGISERYDRRFRRKDGSTLWAIISATSIFDEANVFQGAFAMFTDITDRIQAEQALAAHEKLLSEMSRLAKIGAWEYDPLTLKGTWTDETARIHDLIPGNETNLEEALSCYKGEFHQKIVTAMNNCIDKGEPFDLEFELISPERKHKWVRAIGNPTLKDGRVVKVQGTLHDITERKMNEEALLQSNNFLNSIIDQSAHAMWISDEKGTLIRINPACCKLLNITPVEVIGKYNIFKDNIIKEQNLLSYVKSVYKEGKTARFAIRYDSSQLKSIQVKNTSNVILDVTIFPIKDINGKITNAVIHHTNITERKIAEDALRQSEFKFRKFVEEASVGILLIDENGLIIEWNRAMQELTGLPRDEIMYTPCWDMHWRLIPEETRKFEVIQILKSQIQQALQTGEASFLYQPMEMAIKTPDGKTCHLLQSVFPIKFEHGYWLGVITRDITKRKIAEENLRQSEDKFSKAFQASPNILVITRLSDGKIIEVNDVFVEIAGHLREEVIGRTPLELNMWVDRKQLRTYLTAIKEQNHAREIEVRFLVKPNKVLDCLLSGDIISLNNEPCILSTIRDITERKSQEAQIERQLQRLAALRSIDMAITSSFDLRVTLGIILDHVTTQLNVDAAEVLTLNPNLNCLEFAAQRGFHNAGFSLQRFYLNNDPASQATTERHLVSIPDLKKAGHPLATSKLVIKENFAACFIAPLLVKGQVKGVLEVFHRAPLNPSPDWLSFFEAIAGQTAIAVDNAELFQGLQRSNAELMMAYNDTLEGWSTALDLRDKETEGHSQRVVELTLQLAQALGINKTELVHIRRGALLHDIGKMGVPDSILLKPGALSQEEWQIKLKHPEYAYQMLSPISYLRPALDIPYCHHEKWDGTGYPRGLKGEQIPLSARIFALVDVWDALRSDRPYRPAWSDEEALKYIREQSGIHFDPEVVEAFFHLLPTFKEHYP